MDIYDCIKTKNYNEIKKRISDGFDINKYSVCGNTPLIYTIKNSDWSMFKFLLDNGAILYTFKTDPKYRSVFQWLVFNKDILDEVLRNKLISVDTIDDALGTLLMYSAMFGNKNMMKLLIEKYNADPYLRCNNKSALDVALISLNYRAIRYLIVERGLCDYNRHYIPPETYRPPHENYFKDKLLYPYKKKNVVCYSRMRTLLEYKNKIRRGYLDNHIRRLRKLDYMRDIPKDILTTIVCYIL